MHRTLTTDSVPFLVKGVDSPPTVFEEEVLPETIFVLHLALPVTKQAFLLDRKGTRF